MIFVLSLMKKAESFIINVVLNTRLTFRRLNILSILRKKVILYNDIMTSLSKLAFKHFVSISFYARGNIIQMMRTRARDEDVMVLIENNLREHLHHFSNEYVRGKCLIKYYKMFTQRR